MIVSEVFEFNSMFNYGDFIELVDECEFNLDYQSMKHSYENGKTTSKYEKNNTLPKGTLLRVDEVKHFPLFEFSFLLKYNKGLRKDNPNLPVGKFSNTLSNMSGLRYRVVKRDDIDKYITIRDRKRKIEKVVK